MTNPRIWLITGASSGFGLELAKAAAAHGDNVIATSRNPQKMSALNLPPNIKLARLDQNEPLPQIKTAMQDIISIFGTVDIVVNNAAYVQTGILEESSTDEVLQQFRANVFGPLDVYRAVLPYLREKKDTPGSAKGTLVTIGSMAAWFPLPGGNLYNASKATMRLLSIGLAGEVAPFGIRHTLIEPGYFRTELLNPNTNMTKTSADQRIPAYAEVNAMSESGLAQYNGAQLGDPVKGVEIIYDVITSTGVAAGKELPEFLPLGSDAVAQITESAQKAIAVVDEWRDISVLSDFPSGK